MISGLGCRVVVLATIAFSAIAQAQTPLPDYPRDDSRCTDFATRFIDDDGLDLYGNPFAETIVLNGGNGALFQFTLDDHNVIGRLAFNGIFGYLAFGLAGVTTGGMLGGRVIMATRGSVLSTGSLDLSTGPIVQEYVISETTRDFAAWMTPFMYEDPGSTGNGDFVVETTSDGCYTSLSFDFHYLAGEHINMGGTNTFAWAANNVDSSMLHHGANRGTFVIDWTQAVATPPPVAVPPPPPPPTPTTKFGSATASGSQTDFSTASPSRQPSTSPTTGTRSRCPHDSSHFPTNAHLRRQPATFSFSSTAFATHSSSGGPDKSSSCAAATISFGTTCSATSSSGCSPASSTSSGKISCSTGCTGYAANRLSSTSVLFPTSIHDAALTTNCAYSSSSSSNIKPVSGGQPTANDTVSTTTTTTTPQQRRRPAFTQQQLGVISWRAHNPHKPHDGRGGASTETCCRNASSDKWQRQFDHTNSIQFDSATHGRHHPRKQSQQQ
jgi:hypothetical protein